MFSARNSAQMMARLPSRILTDASVRNLSTKKLTKKQKKAAEKAEALAKETAQKTLAALESRELLFSPETVEDIKRLRLERDFFHFRRHLERPLLERLKPITLKNKEENLLDKRRQARLLKRHIAAKTLNNRMEKLLFDLGTLDEANLCLPSHSVDPNIKFFTKEDVIEGFTRSIPISFSPQYRALQYRETQKFLINCFVHEPDSCDFLSNINSPLMNEYHPEHALYLKSYMCDRQGGTSEEIDELQEEHEHQMYLENDTGAAIQGVFGEFEDLVQTAKNFKKSVQQFYEGKNDYDILLDANEPIVLDKSPAQKEEDMQQEMRDFAAKFGPDITDFLAATAFTTKKNEDGSPKSPDSATIGFTSFNERDTLLFEHLTKSLQRTTNEGSLSLISLSEVKGDYAPLYKASTAILDHLTAIKSLRTRLLRAQDVPDEVQNLELSDRKSNLLRKLRASFRRQRSIDSGLLDTQRETVSVLDLPEVVAIKEGINAEIGAILLASESLKEERAKFIEQLRAAKMDRQSVSKVASVLTIFDHHEARSLGHFILTKNHLQVDKEAIQTASLVISELHNSSAPSSSTEDRSFKFESPTEQSTSEASTSVAAPGPKDDLDDIDGDYDLLDEKHTSAGPITGKVIVSENLDSYKKSMTLEESMAFFGEDEYNPAEALAIAYEKNNDDEGEDDEEGQEGGGGAPVGFSVVPDATETAVSTFPQRSQLLHPRVAELFRLYSNSDPRFQLFFEKHQNEDFIQNDPSFLDSVVSGYQSLHLLTRLELTRFGLSVIPDPGLYMPEKEELIETDPRYMDTEELAKSGLSSRDRLKKKRYYYDWQIERDEDEKGQKNLIFKDILRQSSKENERIEALRTQQSLKNREHIGYLRNPYHDVISKLKKGEKVDSVPSFGLGMSVFTADGKEKRRLNGIKFDIEIVKHKIIEPNTMSKFRKGFVERKVLLRVRVDRLNLSPVSKERLLSIVGPRYNSETGILKLVGDSFPNKQQNTTYVFHLLRQLLNDAMQVDPCFVPFSDLESKATDALVDVKLDAIKAKDVTPLKASPRNPFARFLIRSRFFDKHHGGAPDSAKRNRLETFADKKAAFDSSLSEPTAVDPATKWIFFRFPWFPFANKSSSSSSSLGL